MRGLAFDLDSLRTVLWAIQWLVIAYFVLLNGAYLAMSVFAFGALRRYARRMKATDVEDLVAFAGAPPIAVIAPAYNEEATCVDAVRALLALRYPSYDLIVVNDGSKDRTLERLRDAFDLEAAPRAPMSMIPTAPVRGVYRSRRRHELWVIDKENGGKADALNVGINFSRAPLFCAMDADSLLERDALLRIVWPFLENSRTVASGGVIRIANGCNIERGAVAEVRLPRSPLAQFQVLEYLRAFLAGRMGWDAIDATLIISGAFGLFRRSAVVEVGGYATRRTSGETVGEDMELVVRLHRRLRERGTPYRISFVPDPVAWTECPESLRVLGRQRDRWQRGLIEALSRHRRMLLNPRFGRVGLLAFPYFFFLEMLGPLVEMLGYCVFVTSFLLGWWSTLHAIAFLLVAFVLGIALSIAAVGLEELSFHRYPRLTDLGRLFGLAVLENVGYRQLSSWWRLQGILSSLRGAKGWGSMERQGFATRRAA